MYSLGQMIEDKAFEKGSLLAFANIVKNLNLSLEEAIVAAGIPENERERYIAKVKELM